MACAEAKHRIAEAIRIFFMGYPFRLNSGNAKLSHDCSNISLDSLPAQSIPIIICSILAAYQTIHSVSLPRCCYESTRTAPCRYSSLCFFCEILQEFLMNSKAIHKFAKSLPSRVKCRLRGCSSMVEQKLPKLTTRVRFPSPAPFSLAPGFMRRGHLFLHSHVF